MNRTADSSAVMGAGLLDLQVNGFGGVDFNAWAALTSAAIDGALEALLATGVTAFLPTVITAPAAVLAARLAALDAAIAASRLGPLMVPGYHLEGPFVNPGEGYHGCHPAAAAIAPDAGLVATLEAPLARPILVVTLAPELPGAGEAIRALRARGKLVAVGHSAAGFAEVAAAADAGATLATHLGNGVPQELPKLANTIFAQLGEDRLAAGFIADGIHLPPPALKVLLRAKGLDRAFLVTDATSAAAMPAGLYPFAGMTIERGADGVVREPGGRYLAGSSLCLDAAVRNLVAWGFASPREAQALASTHPHALLAPVLAAHGITLPESTVAWSPTLHPLEIRLGAETRRLADPLPS